MSKNADSQEISRSHEDKPSLHQYIEENHKLITTLGVFTALTLFARQSVPDFLGSLLSALFLTLALLVWFELAGRVPPRMGTSTMYWFESTLTFCVMVLSFYWFLSVRSVFPWLSMFLTFFLAISVISTIMKRFDLFNRVFRAEPGEKKSLRYFMSLLLVSIAVTLSILAAIVTNLYVDPWIDSILK